VNFSTTSRSSTTTSSIDQYRRGELSLHCRYGFLPGLMTAGYIGFAAPRLVASDACCVRLMAELMQRLGAAECFQWYVRRQPMGSRAGGRSRRGHGLMFEICARLGSRDDRLQRAAPPRNAVSRL
jgi:hypothetical protein